MLFDTMYINAQMQVLPCCNACVTDVSFYDLKENLDLEAAWNSEGYRKYRSIFLDKADDSESICKECLLRMKGVERFML
jgi:radical SAM protein with 4Fe4S-binding SPASM domain